VSAPAWWTAGACGHMEGAHVARCAAASHSWHAGRNAGCCWRSTLCTRSNRVRACGAYACMRRLFANNDTEETHTKPRQVHMPSTCRCVGCVLFQHSKRGPVRKQVVRTSSSELTHTFVRRHPPWRARGERRRVLCPTARPSPLQLRHTFFIRAHVVRALAPALAPAPRQVALHMYCSMGLA
jgi:hypothetical protein